MQLVDTHAHLTDPQLAGDEAAILARAAAAGVAAIVDVGTDLATSRAAIHRAQQYRNVVANVGIHPHEAKTADDAAFAELRCLATQPQVVAIGECGLDYFRDHSPRDIQRRVFACQLAMAKELGIPAVIHCRDAYPDCLDIVAAELGVEPRGVLHCFLGDAAAARRALDLGLHLGIGGGLTRQEALRPVVAALPLDRLLVETDCPYQTPRPRRGRNEPAFVRLVAECLAATLGLPLDRVAEATTANACHLLALPLAQL
ncbi:MAG: TatD family deoxyribonuclease [Planctomycetes bacterium]|nr:TatD family deoxyribonuclease [Planctomycetota bacterium]